MPHVTVEYSANLTDALDIQSLVDRIHEAVLASGPFERAAARTRSRRMAATPRPTRQLRDG